MTRKIVIVDDDNSFVEPLIRQLSSFDVEVKWVRRASEFLKIVEGERPDLFVIAVELPDGNGFSLCKKLKEDEGLKKVPVILVLRKENIEMAKNHQKLKTRADAYFTKPIEPKQFIGHMEDVMRAPLKKKVVEKREEIEVEVEPEREIEVSTSVSRPQVDVEGIDEEIGRFVRRISEFKSKISALQTENEDLRRKIKKREMEVEELTLKVRSLDSELDVKNRKIGELESEIRDLKREIESIKEELKRERKEKEEVELKLTKKTKEAEELQKELKEVKLKLEKEVSLKVETLKQVEKLKEEIHALREKETKLLREKGSLEEEKKKLEEMLSGLKEDKKVLEKALNELKEERDEIERRLKEVEAERDALMRVSKRISEPEREEWLSVDEAIGKIDRIGDGAEMKEIESEEAEPFEESISETEEISDVVQEVEGVSGEPEEEEEIKLPEESVLGEDEEISKAIDDFFTQTEFSRRDSFEESLDFMIKSAKEDLGSITISEDKVLQKVARIVDIYNHLFRYIFDRMKESMPSSDPQRIFNDYFTDLRSEKAEIFRGISFNENGELDSFSMARNVINFVKEMSIPKSEVDRTAFSIISEVMGELLDFVKFTFSNILPDEVSEDINEKAELLTSQIRSLERA